MSDLKKCGKSAAPFIPRWGWSLACVLVEGHEGDCQQGGECFFHGEYIGERCPQWPCCSGYNNAPAEPAALGMNLCQNLVPRVCLPCTLPVGHKGQCSPEITATEPAAESAVPPAIPEGLKKFYGNQRYEVGQWIQPPGDDPHFIICGELSLDTLIVEIAALRAQLEQARTEFSNFRKAAWENEEIAHRALDDLQKANMKLAEAERRLYRITRERDVLFNRDASSRDIEVKLMQISEMTDAEVDRALAEEKH